MDIQEFANLLATLDPTTRQALRDFVENQSERNECFTIGYITALNYNHIITDEAHSYLMGFICNVDTRSEEAAHLLSWKH